MNKGILYVAFGEEFDKLSAASARYSRQFTSLPIHVLTNLRERDPNWEDVGNVSFGHINIKTNLNREIKTSIYTYTPFDLTLYLSSDCVIQQHGIDTMFVFLKRYDIVCQHYAILKSADDKNFERAFIAKTYDKLMKLLNISYPLEWCSEAAYLFRRSDGTKKFFKLYHDYWKLMGSGRDMPAFCCAVRNLFDNVRVIQHDEYKLVTNKERGDYFVQHKGFEGFEKKFGLPNYKDWNPQL